MACFIVPVTEAVVVTIVDSVIQKKDKNLDTVEAKEEKQEGKIMPEGKSYIRKKLRWLSTMLWGGSFLLAFEHVWHGEVTPWFPFLTAASNPADKAEMLYEMSTSGVAMAVLVTAIWGVMVLVSRVLERKAVKIMLDVK